MRELSCGSVWRQSTWDGVVSVPITMYGHAAKTIHAYTGLLIWIGHAPFHKHKREAIDKHRLVYYLELNVLPKCAGKDARTGPNC